MRVVVSERKRVKKLTVEFHELASPLSLVFVFGMKSTCPTPREAMQTEATWH
jgi:hypothetical protein